MAHVVWMRTAKLLLRIGLRSRVMPINSVKRYLSTIRAHVVERAMLLSEQQILTLILEKAARLEADGTRAAVDYSVIREFDAKNAQRLAELERRKINRLVFPLRAAVLRLPRPIQNPIRAALRPLFGFKAARESALVRDRMLSRTPAAAVPFGPAFPPPSLSQPLGVIMHIFYPELAGEMRDYLENIPGPVELYISTDTPAKQDALERTFAGWTAGQVHIRLAPNRGRDIAPKLVTWRDVYDRHAVVLHLHSKKSPHESILRLWRYFLFENLLGERAVAASILSALEHIPTLGIVASDHYFGVSNGIVWGGNLDIAMALADRMRVSIDPHAALDFPSGSMFWAKSAAIRPLLDLDLSFEDFPVEAGQKDGTLAHAIERLFLFVSRSAGFDWIQVSRGRLADPARCPPEPLNQVSDLVARLGKASAAA